MRKRALFVGALLTASILLSACGKSSSKAEPQPNKGEENGYEPVTIRLAYNLPQDHHISIGVENFAKTVTEKSGGKVKIQVYPAGQLLSDKEMNQAILTGGVEMGVNSSTLWASTVPAMGIFDVPYAFPNHETAGKALSGELREKLNKAMEEKGVKVLMYADYGYAQFANNVRPLKSPEDFKGLKIRSIGDIPSEMIKAYGASPVFLGAGEVYTALQRKTIDGATSGTTAMLQRHYDEVAKYLTINNYSYLEFILAVNKNFWDRLPEKTKNLLTETAQQTEQWIRAKAKEEDERTAKELEKKGMEVYVVPESDLPKWKKAAQPAREVYIERAGDLGKELLDMVENIQ
ncbi:TRAP dicarboxylate transporter-DctP subunit [Geobacillus thermoleovorans CCB_US3_UF5]|uniref:C4-dicarboxylate ABC transporter substrate-binding protein n=3 Tax=Geobacillus TaxID=129337 RepID=A0A7U9JB82_GEOTM|nr:MULTISPECIES: DctP family TRAP transporter solute-binding subunit [Geobacillus]AEV18155.1 TRAP dicarboxylate transporter-DctP subunit [Geobacillus thermoleovorans CCB_US3_UF5]ESU72309.1 C4-dicarboxylate ABC transporter substrate-binding protein [Geobacillus sp. MAS1]OQP18118.1 C4-dicarboxylate ABC transporter [Geobacillus zalihae]QDY72435.1 DctP family TRAP transporter solute-binding subunit [Geobacillus thermoleovorans]TRY37121.1 DctP family TRAP transporter solute-binding subunit [Geobaci